MEIIKAHHRKITCEVCSGRLISVYVRGKTFRSLEGYYWCSACSKIFQLKEGEKNG